MYGRDKPPKNLHFCRTARYPDAAKVIIIFEFAKNLEDFF